MTTPIQVSSQGEVILGEKAFLVEVADTDTLRTRGLSGHVPLSEEEGMLFIFDRPDNYGFWMKDMNFPIDIVWMDESLKIVHIEKNISPETYPKVLRPTEKSLFVLEISAGQSDLLNIKVGDEVKFLRK
ncbi:hypothetical protein A3J19_00635 [Candidatus Daviesbacteria bacterium RIFCSPLOWO2_02_FULL_41_8]|uniref:DUF192 domain-containing protein n=1 Tax=Candidatus Daviesbacteria bacterium RIFCSPLOWO2_02_FULL_41_8 TaxID=1797798 RepID=A0A1F5NLZ6_9BACT|nr:MAG: hypothetical protein A3J19_00635 [Candidatus Daviesbacteria bacterium RIFCSPLOWO2_02_FULL_41_8]